MTASIDAAQLDRWIDEFIAYVEFEKGLAANTVARVPARPRGVAERSARERSSMRDRIDSRRRDRLPRATARREASRRRSRSAPSSVARMLVSLRVLLPVPASTRSSVDVDPDREGRRPEAAALDPEGDRRRGRRAAARAPGPDDLLGRRDRAILETLYGAGLRISELVGLDVDDVDLDEGIVLVRVGQGRESPGVVPLGRAGAQRRSRPT